MRIKIKNLAIALSLPTLILFCLCTFAQAQFEPAGQAVVTDDRALTDNNGALFLVDLTPGLPTFGQRTLVTDFGDPSQGPTGRFPLGVVLDDFGNALVVTDDDGTNNDGVLLSVILPPMPGAGNRTLISDFGDPAQGPIGGSPIGMALDSSGNALVLDDGSGTNNDGLLFHVDISSGQRTIISDFGDPAQGPVGACPNDIVLYDAGSVLVTDEDAGTDSRGVLFKIDLATGIRTVISDFSDPAQGPIAGSTPFGLSLDSSGNALVTDEDASNIANGKGVLYIVDLTPGPTLGNRIIASNFDDPLQGPLGQEPQGITLNGSGVPLVIDASAGSDDLGILFQVNITPGPSFGDRTIISDFNDPSQGPVGNRPRFVAFRSPPELVRPIPTLSEWGLIATAGVLGLAGLYAVRRRKAIS